MERLAEQIVAWHNRHPLARRVAPGDVHTIGVVALPFVRASAQAGGVVEPVLTDAVSFDELAAAPRPSRLAGWLQQLSRLAPWLNRRPRTQWRAFNEKFLPGLSPARVESFALAHGFADPPAEPDARPWRVVVIDEALASTHSGWPFELYLMSAGIDVGNARTRVLTGRGIPSQVIGRRLWDPLRVGLAAGALVLPLAVGGWLLRPHQAAAPVAEPAAAASAPAAAPATAPASTAPAASAPASGAGSGAEAASAPASSASATEPPASEAADGPPADIRPHLVERSDGVKRPPLLSSKPAETATEKAAEKATEKATDKPAERPAEKAAEKPANKAANKAADKVADSARKPEPVDPRLARLAQSPDKTVVALVGPPGSKAEAEALLKKMQAGLVGVHSDPDALQADVIQTPDGWRATIWPFPSREQAQLINATLVARGLKTKAVNF